MAAACEHVRHIDGGSRAAPTVKIIAINGVTISGNMGGAAMLKATLREIRARFPGCRFSLLSVSPDMDRAQNHEPDLDIVDTRPVLLMLIYLPLALLCLPLSRFRIIRKALCAIPYFRALAESEALLDLCGIAFVDGRGLPLLAYNVACCLPAFAVRTPVIKLSQALGPFESFINRMAALFTLRRCKKVIARGDTSGAFLAGLGIDSVTLPDTSFSLNVPVADREAAIKSFRELGLVEKPIILSPSRVVANLCEKGGIDFYLQMTGFIEKMALRGETVVLLPHSLAAGSGKNNDVIVCEKIKANLPKTLSIHSIYDIHDPVRLRAMIGQARLLIGCRFHSVVAALAMGVPPVVIGWSHKYREMVAPLGIGDEWTINYSVFTTEKLVALVNKLMENEDYLRATIATRLPEITRLSAMNFDITEKIINEK